MNSTPRTPTLTLVLTVLVVAAPLAAAGILPGGVPGVNEAPWGAWHVETLDSRSIYTAVGLDVTGAGDARVLYTGGEWNGSAMVGGMYVANQENLVWGRERVTGLYRLPGDLVLDDSDRPHIVYQEERAGETYFLMYATRSTSGSWEHVELADHAIAGNAKILLDGAGEPHVLVGANNKVHHYYRSASGWQSEIVSNEDGEYLDMAWGPEGRLHAAYQMSYPSDSGPQFAYATRNADGSWSEELVDVGCWTSLRPALAVDSQGTPHVACHGLYKGFQHAWKTSDGVWEWELIDDGTFGGVTEDVYLWREDSFWIGYTPSLTVDSGDTLHVSYRHKDNVWSDTDVFHRGELWYAQKEAGGEWKREVVDGSDAWTGFASDLVLDGEERPHVAYVTAVRFSSQGCEHRLNTCFDLKYATPLTEPLNTIGE